VNTPSSRTGGSDSHHTSCLRLAQWRALPPVRRAGRLLSLALLVVAALLTEGCTPTPGQLLLARIRAVLDLPTLADAPAVASALGVQLGRHSAWSSGEGLDLTSGSLVVGRDSLISIAVPVADLIADPSVSAAVRRSIESRLKMKPPLRADLPRVDMLVFISPDDGCITMDDLVANFGSNFRNYIFDTDLKFRDNIYKQFYHGQYIDVAIFDLGGDPFRQISYTFSGNRCVQSVNVMENDWNALNITEIK